MLIVSLLITVGFFTASGLHLHDRACGQIFRSRHDWRRDDLAARIALAAICFTATLLACFLPITTAIVSSTTLSLSAQLLPAFLGVCWLRWISRSAVIAGLIVGSLLVIFTEPPGLVLFDRLFVELPWGRWPLTIHSAAWGLAFNLAACLIVSLWTRNDVEHRHRDQLHDIYLHDGWIAFGGRAARGASGRCLFSGAFRSRSRSDPRKHFFSRPIFIDKDASLGVPSLWVWQAIFWIAGVLLVWWLAYRVRLSIVDVSSVRTRTLAGRQWSAGGSLQPKWIESRSRAWRDAKTLHDRVKAAP